MRALPPIIIILSGIIAPPVIAYAIAGGTGVVILYAVTAPSVLLLALLAPEVSTSPRGPEDRTVEGVRCGQPEINATITHEGER